jgi:hypothetical protein
VRENQLNVVMSMALGYRQEKSRLHIFAPVPSSLSAACYREAHGFENVRREMRHQQAH